MQPRIFRRWVSTVRKGRKGHLYRPEVKPVGPTAEEQVRQTKRRVQKAERDERMDITLALTPPKTWMGGFTRPRDLRAANWFPGGPYLQKNKVYESPHESAYEPHTVFLLETRHRVRHGIGRVDGKDHIVGVCRAVDFVKLVRKYNSKRCPLDTRESLDNACWPWLPKSGKVLRPTRWWGHDEKLEDIMREIYEDDTYVSQDVEKIISEAEDEVEEVEEQGGNVSNKANKRKGTVVNAGAEAGIKDGTKADKTAGDDSSPVSSKAEGTLLRHEPPHIIGQAPERHDAAAIRNLYEPRLTTEPFWLPLLAITCSTRPLALTLSRLSKGRERGLPFYASMSNDDRKCLFSYSYRMTNMRLDRMRHLALEIIKRFAGHQGGFVGIRFSTTDKGRGINGEGLADPIPPSKRIVKVQVGDWFDRAQDEADLYREEAEEWGGPDAVNVSLMNEWGRRLDAHGNEVPLTIEEMSTDEIQETEEDEDEDEEDADTETDQDSDKLDTEHLLRNPSLPGRRWKLKPELLGDEETAVALRRKLAYQLGAKHRGVIGV